LEVQLPHTPQFSRVVPATISFVLSVVCVIVIYLLVRDRWIDPEIKPTEQAELSTTGQAARSAGARLSPTEPKPSIEPKPEGPKQVQPAIPN
jgi:hypothetical protein